MRLNEQGARRERERVRVKERKRERVYTTGKKWERRQKKSTQIQ